MLLRLLDFSSILLISPSVIIPIILLFSITEVAPSLLDVISLITFLRPGFIEIEVNAKIEKFYVEEIIPTSDHTAVVNFVKTKGKVAVAFFYYINKLY